MIKRYTMLAFIFLITAGLILSIPMVNGESEPNDDLSNAEMLSEGTFSGSVNDTDPDFFLFTIPARMDMVFTLKKMDYENGMISTTSYDSTRMKMLFSGITLTATNQGVEVQDSYWNAGDISEDIYIEIRGNGDYEFTVEITNDSEEAVEELLQMCGVFTAIMVCLPIIIIGGISLIFIAMVVIVIVAIVKSTKKNK